MKAIKKRSKIRPFISGGRAGTRTLDPLIKSQLLYQLSYASKSPFYLISGHNYIPFYKKSKFNPSSGNYRIKTMTLCD